MSESFKMKSREELEEIFTRISKKYDSEDAHLELATDERVEAIIKFAAEEFAPDEPLGRALGIVHDDEANKLLSFVLEDNISVLLVSDKADDAGKIIAAVITTISNKDDDMELLLKQMENKTHLQSYKFVSHKDNEANTFDKYGVDQHIDLSMLGVDRGYRKQGLATKVMEAALEFYSEMSLDPVVLKADATSNYSKKIFKKFGFEMLHELFYDEYMVDGKILLNNMGEDKSCIVYTKMLPPKK